MKYSKLATLVLILAVSPALVHAAELSELDTSAIPNTFSNGAAADADEVNANFEYIRENLDVLVALLKERNVITSDADRFSGSYEVTGTEITMDSCDGAPQINHSIIRGTAVSANGEISFSNDQIRYTLRDGHLDDASSHIDTDTLSESFSTTIGSDGNFADVSGRMSADGSTFYLADNWEESSDCSSAGVVYFHGFRILP